MGLWPIFRFGESEFGRSSEGAAMLRDTLEELLAPVVERVGCELWELEYSPRAGGALLRLYIDAAHGISLEDCERVSRAVSEELDATDPIPVAYTLEVSSPGLDRVLRTPAHFARYRGEQARVELSELLNGRRRFVGRVVEADDRALILEVDGERLTLPMKGIRKARLAPVE
jgi:ribosome maturation factor RimP